MGVKPHPGFFVMQRLMDIMASSHTSFMDVLEASRTRRGGFFRNLTLATMADGPDVRTIILRAITADGLVMFTDKRSPKYDQLQHDHRAAIHAYDPHAKLQVRGYGQCMLKVGEQIPPNYLHDAMKRPEDYASISKPGSMLVTEASVEMNKDDAPNNLAVILFRPHLWDVLELHVEGHRRFAWGLESGEWVGSWRTP